MTQVSILLASISLATAALLYVKVDRLEQLLGSSRAGPREGRIEATGRDVALAMPEQRAYAGGASVDAAVDAHGRRAAAAAASGGSAGTRDGGLSVEDRLARLEDRQRTLEGGPGLPWRRGGQHVVRSIDDLSRQLSLTPTQRSRIEDVIGRGRQRIEDVLKIPDESGKSPFERRAEARKKLEEAMRNPERAGFLALATDLVMDRQRKIPGRGDTYGDEIERIRKETREEMAAALDAQQQETFRDTNVDGLLGEAAQVSFAYAVGDAGGEGGGMVIEMESTVDDVDESTPAPPSPDEGR